MGLGVSHAKARRRRRKRLNHEGHEEEECVSQRVFFFVIFVSFVANTSRPFSAGTRERLNLLAGLAKLEFPCDE